MKMHKLEQELESATKHVVDLENFAARRQVILNKLQKDYEIPVVASEVTYDAQTERKLDELSHVPWLGKKAIGLQEAATRVKTQALHEMAEQENTQPQAPQLATGPDENEARRGDPGPAVQCTICADLPSAMGFVFRPGASRARRTTPEHVARL